MSRESLFLPLLVEEEAFVNEGVVSLMMFSLTSILLMMTLMANDVSVIGQRMLHLDC